MTSQATGQAALDPQRTRSQAGRRLNCRFPYIKVFVRAEAMEESGRAQAKAGGGGGEASRKGKRAAGGGGGLGAGKRGKQRKGMGSGGGSRREGRDGDVGGSAGGEGSGGELPGV